MGLTRNIARRYQHHTLRRIQRRFDKLQQSEPAARSRLRQWLLAADHVERVSRRTLFGTLSLLLLLPALWLLLPLLPQQELPPPTAQQSPPPSPPTPPARPKPEYQVALELPQDRPETVQILEKIRQRPLPIEIQPVPGEPQRLLLIDRSPTTRQQAEQLQVLYSQLFGVEGRVVTEPLSPAAE